MTTVIVKDEDGIETKEVLDFWDRIYWEDRSEEFLKKFPLKGDLHVISSLDFEDVEAEEANFKFAQDSIFDLQDYKNFPEELSQTELQCFQDEVDFGIDNYSQLGKIKGIINDLIMHYNDPYERKMDEWRD